MKTDNEVMLIEQALGKIKDVSVVAGIPVDFVYDNNSEIVKMIDAYSVFYVNVRMDSVEATIRDVLRELRRVYT